MSMSITEIHIVPVKPNSGLVGFASCVIEKCLYLGSIGIFTRPDGSYRLVYPTKKIGEKNINIFYPINSKLGQKLEQEIISKFEEVMNHDRHSSISNQTK